MVSKKAKPKWGYEGAVFISSFQPSIKDEEKLRREISNILTTDVSDEFFIIFKDLISGYRNRGHNEKTEPKMAEVAEELRQLQKAAQPLLNNLGKEADAAYESNKAISISAQYHINQYLENNDKLISKSLDKVDLEDTDGSALLEALDQQRNNGAPIITQLAENLIWFSNAIDLALEDITRTLSGGRSRSYPRRWLAHKLAAAFVDILKIVPTKTKDGVFEKCLIIAIRESGEKAPKHIAELVRETIDS